MADGGPGVVAGVEVDPRHWIGGSRVASARSFADLSPIDETELAQISAGDAAEADAADHLLRLEHDDFLTRGHRNHVSWDPAGVTAVITPWNAPLMLATWRIAPALAAGNTVVLKPPEWAPLTASLLANITAEAGLPAGVFNVVQGVGAQAGAGQPAWLEGAGAS